MKHGKIIIKLDRIIKQSDISKNKLCQRAEIQRAQLNNYCNNSITRINVDVLARICTVLDCKIEDVIEFIPFDSDE